MASTSDVAENIGPRDSNEHQLQDTVGESFECNNLHLQNDSAFVTRQNNMCILAVSRNRSSTVPSLERPFKQGIST